MKRFFIYLRKRPFGFISLILIIFLYLLMGFAEFIAPYGPNEFFPGHTYHPPNLRFFNGKPQAQEWQVTSIVSWRYVPIRGQFEEISLFAKTEPYRLWGLIPMERRLFSTIPDSYPIFIMGADHLGRDLFSRIIYGSRISLTIGFVATAISLTLAMLFGGLSGFYGGKTDWTIMRLAEFFMLIPGLYLILFLRSLFATTMDSGQAYMMITLILSLVGWPGSARTIRGMVHAIKREEFILNSRLEMIPSPVIIFRHIIPQIASLLIVSVALSIPGFIMTETTLSYLGLGIVDPAVSWGSLIRREVSTVSNLQAFPWLLSPVWFLLGLTLAFNYLGDALRDYFDPYHTIFFKFSIKNILNFKNLAQRPIEPSVREHKGTKSRPNLKSPAHIPKPSPPFEQERRESLNNEPHLEAERTLRASVSAVPLCEEKQNQSLLTVKDLTVNFTVLRGQERISVQAVRGLSFEVGKGEILGIVGESGSGKSVSVQAVPGLLPKNARVSGSVLYDGEEILGLPTKVLRAYRGKKIGMIFQEPGRSYDPLQNMEKVFLETFRNSEPEINREEARDKAVSLLNETGLVNARERLSNFPHQFSGGQLQRISIALALAQGCELLIADEPTTALDVTIQKQIVELLKTLRESRFLSIIFISHDIDLVTDISDRLMVMYGGLLMETAVCDIISSGKSLHPYTKALLAASPRFGSHYSQERLQVIPGKVTDPVNPESGCPFAPRCSLSNSACRESIPPLIENKTHLLRCIHSGVPAPKAGI